MHDAILKPTADGDGMINRFRSGLLLFFSVQCLFASWALAHPGGVDQAGPYDLIVTSSSGPPILVDGPVDKVEKSSQLASPRLPKQGICHELW
jgi:hypothetical protein